MTGIRKAKQEEIVEKEAPPIVTLLVMLGPPMLAGLLGQSGSPNVNMMTAHAFTARKAASLLVKSDWGGLINIAYQATFDHMTAVLFLINLGFLYIFGCWLEKKLWGWRYAAFMVLGIFVPWAILYFDVQGSNPDKMFISPLMMMLFMAGGYFAVKPVKPFVPQDWVRPSWKIFRQERKIPILEQYWVSPYVFIIAFIVYASAVNALMDFTRNQIVDLPYSHAKVGEAHRWVIGRIDHSGQIAAFSWLAGLGCFVAGAIGAPLLLGIKMTTTAKRAGGELQMRALTHYKELRSLDMTHEQALEGTAKFVAVPLDICRDWIAKGQAALKGQRKV